MPNLTSGREFVDTLKITPSEFATLLAAGMPHWKIPGGDNYTSGVFLDTEAVYVWLRIHSTYRAGEWEKLEIPPSATTSPSAVPRVQQEVDFHYPETFDIESIKE